MTRIVPAGRLPLFDFLIDFRNERFFGPTIRSCRVEKFASGDQGIGEGTEFWFEYKILGLVLATKFRIEDVVPGRRFLIRSVRRGIPFLMRYRFEDADSHCRLTVGTTLLDRTWLRWLRWPVESAVRRGMNAYMDSLVKYAQATRLAS
ncbi:MAG: hypothetical protein ACREQQ_09680 [Candidatus Binatia bacterium]